ncbi:MAG: bifunctional 5,10-methylenetetrahydrofolate dehydrogenase/5,10-methenyltetrahydrofolate cyclohydrolase [Solitalea-like symbiont of Tyrophagus putrescentiae]
MKILDGLAASKNLQSQLLKDIEIAGNLINRRPRIAIVLIGDNPASKIYVSNKQKTCASVGIEAILYSYDSSITEDSLIAVINKLNKDEQIDGIIIQQPLPKHINEETLVQLISPDKDIDGFHPLNLGKMQRNDPTAILPATPYGITLLMDYYGIETIGKHCVVLGRSLIVGSPISVLMARNNPKANSTVTLVHSSTKDPVNYTKQADILIVAIGKSNYVTADMVKEGVVIIDVGINRVKQGEKNIITGDVNFNSVASKASAITPVPKGIGPMTIFALLKNTVNAIKIKYS